MFYANVILSKKGVLGKVWLAAHWDKKLNRQAIFQTDVTKSADSIGNPKAAMPLRVSGSLLLGVVRIYSHKVRYLSTDCDEALTKMKMAFRPGSDPLAPPPTANGTGGTAAAASSSKDGGPAAANGTAATATANGIPKPELPDEIEESGGGGVDRPRRKSAQQALLLTAAQHNGKRGGGGNKEEPPPSFLSQRSALDIDAIFPLNEEYYSSAAASQTMARKQDITMEEADAALGRKSFYGAGGSLARIGGGAGAGLELLPGLVQVKDEEPTQESMEVGGGAVSQTQRTHQTQAGVGGEDEEVWEAFDPSKLDLLGAGVEDGGEGGGSGGGGAGAGAVDYSQDYDGVGGGEDDDFRMDDDDGYQGYGDDDLGSLGGAAGMEEEPEAGRAGAGAAGRQEDGDGDGGSLDLEGAGGRRELSLLGGAGSNERVSVGDGDETLALDLGGGAGMEEEEGEGGLVGRASGRDGATPGPAGGVLGLSLLSSAGGGGGGESSGERGGRGGLGLRASPGSEEEGGLLSGRIRIGLGGHRRGSAAGSGAGSALSASIRARLSQEGRKRRLPVDQSLHLSGKQMRDRIADFTDLLEPRVRPRDRARWAAAAGAAGKRRGAGEGEEDEEGEEDDWGLDAEGAGERKGGGAAAAKQQRAASAAAAALALGPMDERMAVHTLSGALAPELEEVFGFMMRRGRAFGLPVARSTVAASSAAGVASPSPFKRQGQEDGSVASEAACGRKRGRDGEGVNGEGAAAAGATPAGGAAVEEDENEFGFGAGDDDFRMDDDGGGFFNGGGGSEDGYGYGGRILGDERDSEEEEEAARRRGGRDEGDSDEDEDEEEDGFIRTNAAGADDDLEAGAAPAAKWHPNTVRMCKLLRARMRKQGGGALGFGKDVAGGARRTKAANMFWEVLQLKTWGFIEVQQAAGPFAEIEISPGERFEEPIPA